jgi:proteasome lid subunit RPN8/RPN11
MRQVMAYAADGGACEVAGFFYYDPVMNGYRVHRLPAQTTPSSFRVPPQDVVDMAYLTGERGWHIIGTFHTHPDGQQGFSQRDVMLCEWAEWHLLLYKEADAWGMNWAKRTSSRMMSVSENDIGL